MKTFICLIDKKMRLKLLTWLLIYCIVIEPSLMNMGCTSFYPSKGDNNLADYKNTEKEILIKFKDNTELMMKTSQLHFVPKGSEFLYGLGEQFDYLNRHSSPFEGVVRPDKIDSEKVVEINSRYYHLIWMHNTRLSFNFEKFYRFEPDLQNDYWVLVNPADEIAKQIYISDIQGIEIRDLDWVKTSLLIVLSLGLLTIFLIAVQSGMESSGGNADCNSHSYSNDCGTYHTVDPDE